MTEKRIKDLERMERMGRSQGILAMFCYGFALVLIITSLITSDKEVNSLGILCWLLGFVFSTQSYQNYNDRRVAILNAAFNKIVDVLTADKRTPEDEVPESEEVPEADTKESVIVSPEDFERFSRGEMTKEELLGIKKAVDKVTEAKKKVDKSEN